MRTIRLRDARLALFLLALFGLGCPPDDADSDGVVNAADDCTHAPDPSQLDADHDGFGNACDADFDQDGLVNFSDLARMKTTFSSSDRVTDLNGDGNVDDADLAILKSLFYLAPGPSAQGNDENLYVSTQGSLSGDGSYASPYRRITDAVAHARADRAALPPATAIRIHVAPGTYVGAYRALALQNNPELEVLPIILNVPKLMVFGSTELVLDALGLPDESNLLADPAQTRLQSERSLLAGQSLFYIGRTADGAAGDGVTIEGFALDGRLPQYGSHTVFADRVTNVRIARSVVMNTGFGIMTRLASLSIEGNLLSGNGEAGTAITGGSLAHPAVVTIRENRVTANGLHGLMMLATAIPSWPINLGHNTLALEPLQLVFDRSDPDDARNIPDRLETTVTGNEFSSSPAFGIRFFGFVPGGTSLGCLGLPLEYRTVEASQALSASLATRVVGNTFAGNGYYDVGMEIGFPCRNEQRQIALTTTADFESNAFSSSPAALFSFTRWSISTGGFSDTTASFKFAERSAFRVTDPDDGLAGFDYDNPVTDPVSGTVLDDTLTVNGVEVPHGKSITP